MFSVKGARKQVMNETIKIVRELFNLAENAPIQFLTPFGLELIDENTGRLEQANDSLIDMLATIVGGLSNAEP